MRTQLFASSFRTWLQAIMTVAVATVAVTAQPALSVASLPMTRDAWMERLHRAQAAGYDSAAVGNQGALRKGLAAGLVLDYAWHAANHPSLLALRAQNCSGVCRYLSYDPNGLAGKNILASEFQYLTEGSTGVTLVWEWYADDCLGGSAKGGEHGKAAVAQAKALGYPAGCAIYGACDFDVSAAQWNAAGRAYYQAFAKELRNAGFQPGIYGPSDALKWAAEDGSVDFGWQASASWSWSGGRNRQLSPYANLSQDAVGLTVDGQSCDRNSIVTAFYGQYLPGQWPPQVSLAWRSVSMINPDGRAFSGAPGRGARYAIAFPSVRLPRSDDRSGSWVSANGRMIAAPIPAWRRTLPARE